MTPLETEQLLKSITQERDLVQKELNDVTTKGPEGGLQPKREEYGEADDQDSYAHEMTDLDRNVAMEQELRTRLNDLDKTIEKIKSGQYGKCENCAQDIQLERLKAVPVAALCMDCARKLDS